ncbi:sigma-70 family RNA polymerase sigma factor [Inquilinus limosus]|uniref:sigma-70 family RNA polymerase sigma factor n=1 Tax=Inquilinus limosus TaxID=171674 RepID=UPI003F167B8F
MTRIKGDPSAGFASLVAPKMPDLRRYAASLTRDPVDAEDLLQETLMRAFCKFHLWRPGTNLMAWLVVMMRRIFLSKFVGASRRAASQFQIEDCEVAVPVNQEQRVDIARIQDSWPRLSHDHREVLEIVAVGGASYDEAADALGVPVGTIRSRLGRARQSLRQLSGVH